jgi:CBS domain containing-hemolysin-like protein
MSIWITDLINIGFAVILVFINGFFVAAEFALVKVRPGRLDELVSQGRIFATTSRWLWQRLDASLSACQLGITMASLGLGWIGEPAVAHLLRPFLQGLGVVSEIWIHGIAFAIAFSGITAAHLVLGEQAPKIYALRRAETMLLWCALPLKFFYFLSYPFMITLNSTTSYLLRKIGIEGGSEHETVHSEDEIKGLLRLAHQHGELSRSEHRLINAVFEFDDTVCRRIMQPRSEILYFDNNLPLSECVALAKNSKHSRYPLCDGSLDRILGVVHIKNLIGITGAEDNILQSITRPAQFVPETMRISRLLRLFQESHQHLALVVDEYGTIVGCVTLEDVLEQIVGPVEDEFDTESPEIQPAEPGQFNIQGGTSLAIINRQLKLQLVSTEAETLSGLLMEKANRIAKVGDRFELEGAEAEVLEMKGSRASRIQLILKPGESPEQ